MTPEDIVYWLIAAIYVAYQLWARYQKYVEEKRERVLTKDPPQALPVPAQQTDELPDDGWYQGGEDPGPVVGEDPQAEPRFDEDPFAAERHLLATRVEGLIAQASALAQAARRDRATYVFADTLEVHVAGRCRDVLQDLLRPGEPPPQSVYAVLDEVELVFAQLIVFVQQRRDPQHLGQLGDADALALRCYEPLFDFARAHHSGLTSGLPVTQLGGYELAIWTGLLQTGLAPIFLPVNFFEEVYWWPAIAHEIGHDFLAASPHADARLRAQLGLPDQLQGSIPLRFSKGGIQRSEIERIFGGWFEEIFCDVIGTLMLGPAYGYAMEALFARPDAPSRVQRIRRDKTGKRYDPHPPRHLRVVMVAAVLELVGRRSDAEQLLSGWAEQHGGDFDVLLLRRRKGGDVSLPLAPVQDVALQLVSRLYGEQLDAFAGYRLANIPGLDWGPHEQTQALEVEATLLSGKVPQRSNARSVIAGAVLARRAAPHKAAATMALTRRAIEGVGTAEHRPNAYDIRTRGTPQAGPAELREAFILHTLLAPPPSARRPGPARRRGGLVGRPW